MNGKMMMVLVALSACGPNPDYVTDLGVEVYGILDKDKANETELWTADLFESIGYDRKDIEACINQGRLHIEQLECDDCGGFQIDGKPDLFVLPQKCEWDTAAGFAHELSHWLQDCLHDPYSPDGYHLEDAIWWHGFATFRHTCQ